MDDKCISLLLLYLFVFHVFRQLSLTSLLLTHTLLGSQQKGDIIDVLSMNASGIWKGRCHGRIGHFKFINVEVLPEQRLKSSNSKILCAGGLGMGGVGAVVGMGGGASMRHASSNGPSSVEDLLFRIGLKEYTSVFVLNG